MEPPCTVESVFACERNRKEVEKDEEEVEVEVDEGETLSVADHNQLNHCSRTEARKISVLVKVIKFAICVEKTGNCTKPQ